MFSFRFLTSWSPKKLYQNSLTGKTLINMASRITTVMFISAGVSYYYMMSDYTRQTKEELERYVFSRGKNESYIFQQAYKNLTLLQKKYVEELESMGNQDPENEFDKTMFQWSDGTIRNAPQNQPIKNFDTTKYSTIFVSPNIPITPEVRRKILVGYKLTNSYGAAWNNNFINTYFNLSEKITIIYIPGFPYSLEMKKDYDISQDEYFYIAIPKNNPEKKPRWTSLYQDPVSKNWMISLIVPIYNKSGIFLGSTGHDIILNQLIDNTLKDNLKGTYNFIISDSGQLIAHPKMMDEIKKKGGQLNITDSNDSHLNRVFQFIKKNQLDTAVIDNSADDEYLAITKLQFTNYYFITVYPKSLLAAKTINSLYFIIISGLIALLVEISILYYVLKNQISNPLNKLIKTAKQIGNRDFSTLLENARKDEIGQLATSFNEMSHDLEENFNNLEEKVNQRTQEINSKNQDLEIALQELKKAQVNLLQAGRMSSLGQLVAGIAHEINNPINFIHGNIEHINSYMTDLIELIYAYQNIYPNSSTYIQEKIETIDLDFVLNDVTKILDSMNIGTTRIQNIILSLRNFSRLDEAELKEINIHEGIDSTLMILQHRLQANPQRPIIEVIKEYTQLPLVNCYPGQLNQVFMNIISNAIDALENKSLNNDFQNPTIFIITTITSENNVAIIIADNGIGIDENIQHQLFDPFFTTKPVGKGIGMGLSISYQIIVDKHEGKLSYDSTPGNGSKFFIEIPF